MIAVYDASGLEEFAFASKAIGEQCVVDANLALEGSRGRRLRQKRARVLRRRFEPGTAGEMP